MPLVAHMNVFDRLRLMWAAFGIYDQAVAVATKEVPMGTKSIFASKVFWFNALAGLIGFAQQQGLFTMIPEPYGPAALILGNMALRFFTTQPVTVTGAPS